MASETVPEAELHTAATSAATSASGSASTSASTSVAAGRFRGLLALSRPGQWIKSLLVVPLPLLDPAVWRLAPILRVGAALLAFTLASVIVYVVNDIGDRERDRLHPVKRHRPLAAGRLPVPVAWLYAAVLSVVLGLLLAYGTLAVAVPVGAYLLLNAAYSRALKHVPLVDAFVVSCGFVLRAVAGCAAAGVEPSAWLLICVFSLCLMLSFGKRRHELMLRGELHRPALRGYSVPYLDSLILHTAVLTAITYLLYLRTEVSAGPHGDAVMLLSVPCAFFGLFRYLQLVLVSGEGGEPVRSVLHDRTMVVNSLVWGALLVGSLLAGQPPL